MDPESDMERNYSMSAARIFTLFAAILVQKGELGSVLRCLESEKLEQNTTRLEGLPSWVPDLRSRILKLWDIDGPDPGAIFLSDRFVVCEVLCMGSVDYVKCDTHYIYLEVLHDDHLHNQKLRNERARNARRKDLLCSLIFNSPKISEWLVVLRDLNSTHEGRDVYQLVAVDRAYFKDGYQRDDTWPLISVCIA